MTKFQKYFRQTITEADFGRSPDEGAITFDDDLPPEAADQFNVDPMDPNVGFEETNVTEDVEKLRELIHKIESISGDMQDISQQIVTLERSFSGITDVSNTIGKLFESLHEVSGELGKYIITLPAEELKKKKEMENNTNEGY